MNLMIWLVVVLVLIVVVSGVQVVNVLVVLFDENYLDLKDGKVLFIGFYFNELMQLVKLLLDVGYEVIFVMLQGWVLMVDVFLVMLVYFGNDVVQLMLYKDLLEKLVLILLMVLLVVSLVCIEQQGYVCFDVVYIFGGYVLMQDLLKSLVLGWLLVDFYQCNKIIVLVCYGLIVLLFMLLDVVGFVVKLEVGVMLVMLKWIYSGYQMMVISNQEEEQVKLLLGGGEMKFYLQIVLQWVGVNFSSNIMLWIGYVVVDCELIIGQNLVLVLEVGQRLVEWLK